MVSTLKIKSENMLKATRRGYLLATDLADYLAGKGETFRSAHAIVAGLVNYAAAKGESLDEISLDEYRQYSPLFGDDVYKINLESAIAARDVAGGTALRQVEEALANAKKVISDFNGG